jgi:hypothetical protein
MLAGHRSCANDLAACGGDAHELAPVSASLALVSGDEVAFGEDQLDLVVEVWEGDEEVVDRRLLAAAPARLAVVDEARAQEPLAGAGVAPVERRTRSLFASRVSAPLESLLSVAIGRRYRAPPAPAGTLRGWAASSHSSR